MTDNLSRLLEIAGESLISTAPRLSDAARAGAGLVAKELLALLGRRNGFFAFESALHLFPCGRVARVTDLDLWNSPGLWRTTYGNLADACWFFAEDAFANQFCVFQGAVHRFDAESAEKIPFARNLEEWAGKILEDYSLHTGYGLAHEWQVAKGPLKPDQRLFGKYPFVLGGAYDLNNLRVFDSVAGLRYLGPIARQIHDLPDGTPINVKVID